MSPQNQPNHPQINLASLSSTFRTIRLIVTILSFFVSQYLKPAGYGILTLPKNKISINLFKLFQWFHCAALESPGSEPIMTITNSVAGLLYLKSKSLKLPLLEPPP
ncbi:hypothetical protein XENORESO_011810 [Xenotaenia resolanae]|uniref:Uncharacterized protein n=1 Tax=Xenotaenia resolanae TaxID=208358 RepID=A0ABV0VX80_9TELE